MKANFLIGADGARSFVRRELGISGGGYGNSTRVHGRKDVRHLSPSTNVSQRAAPFKGLDVRRGE
ncbi:MAG: FAD-dependent monooxygenase [Betaproteobacteria bacterium]|nr:FAD-dependent monooxygenase [Betaproteobacteria bacterium]